MDKARIPPQNTEFEKSVLACMLMDSEAIGRAAEVIDGSCFYRRDHQLIFDAILCLYSQNKPADLLTVGEELRRRKQLGEVGEEMYLAELLETTSTSANAEYYSRVLLEKAILRKLITASGEISSACFEDVEDAKALLDKAEQRIHEIHDARTREGFARASAVLPKAFQKMETYGAKGEKGGVRSGFTALDEIITGFMPGNLVILAARPSVGKTAFAVSLILNTSLQQHRCAALFSLEMSKMEILERMLCAEARIDGHLLKKGRLPKRDYSKLAFAAEPISKADIYIDDSGYLNVLEIRAKARRLRQMFGMDLMIIDYLQLLSGADLRAENRQQEISKISRSLKFLAKELGVPVLALSQLSRQVEIRGKNARPQLSDLRESGAIEQDADAVLFLHRPDPEHAPGIIDVIVGKNRHGPVDTARLTFAHKYGRFENYTDSDGSHDSF